VDSGNYDFYIGTSDSPCITSTNVIEDCQQEIIDEYYDIQHFTFTVSSSEEALPSSGSSGLDTPVASAINPAGVILSMLEDGSALIAVGLGFIVGSLIAMAGLAFGVKQIKTKVLGQPSYMSSYGSGNAPLRNKSGGANLLE